MIVAPAEHVGEPSFRFDVIQLGGLGRGEHRSGALAPAVGAGQQPGALRRWQRNARSAALLVWQIWPSSRTRVKGDQRFSMQSHLTPGSPLALVPPGDNSIFMLTIN